VLLALALSEGIARLLLDPPRYHREAVALDPELGFAGIPGTRYFMSDLDGVHEVVLNRDGLRGRELPSGPAPKGVVRVALLGDSFLFGETVEEEELVTSWLEAELTAGGPRAEVYNLSAADWGTEQQLLYFDRVGPTLAPDTVVLAFFTGNHVVNNALGPVNLTTTSPGDAIRPYVSPEAGGLRIRYLDPHASWLRRRPRIYSILERRFRSFDEQPNSSRRARLKAGRLPLEELELFRRKSASHRWEQAWEDSYALLRRLQERCDALGARLVVAAIPMVHQVQQTAQSIRFDVEARAYSRQPLRRLIDWNEPERRLAEFFRASDIEGVLLLDTLRGVAKHLPRVFARDRHLGVDGHAALGREILRVLSGEPSKLTAASGEPVSLPRDPKRFNLLDLSEESHTNRLGVDGSSGNPARRNHPGGGPSAPRPSSPSSPALGRLSCAAFSTARRHFPSMSRSGLLAGAVWRNRFRSLAPSSSASRPHGGRS
jgi:hypothetical protein